MKFLPVFMKKNNNLVLVVACTAIFVFVGNFFAFQTQVIAIGISGAPVVVDNAVNEVIFTKRIKILRTNETQPSHYNVSVRGDVAKYIVIDNPIFSFAPGEFVKDYDVIIKAKNAPNGKYSGVIQFFGVKENTPNKPGNGGSTLAVNFAASAEIFITVSDRQIKKYEIGDVIFEPVEEQSPIGVNFIIKNTGNVDVRPDRIDLKFVDKTDETNVITMSIPGEKIEYVPPGVSKVVVAQTEKFLEKGSYFASIEFVFDGSVVLSKLAGLIDVFPEGTLAQSLEFLDFNTNKTVFNPGSLIKYTASLNNSGRVSVQPVLYVELIKDGESVDILRSENKFVKRNEKAEFSVSNRIDKIGEYKAEAYFEFGSKQTDKKSVKFKVVNEPEHYSNLIKTVSIIVGAIIVCMLIALVVYKKIKNRNKKAGVKHSFKKGAVHKKRK